MASFNATFQSDSVINATFLSGADFAASFEGVIDHDKYEGAYSVVPNGETQILNTKNYLLTDNITVAPIPSNYGLITWNGAVLTVS